MGRRTGLDIAAFSLGANDFLADLISFDFEAAIRLVEGKGIAQRYGKKDPVKRKNTFHATVKRSVGGVNQSNLDVSVFSVGGTALIGDMKSGRCKVTNGNKEGSGLASLDELPILNGTDYQVEGELLIGSSAHPVLTPQIATTVDRTQLYATVAFTLGGIVYSAPMVAATLKHTGQRDELQKYDVTLESRGTPTTLTPANSLFGLALASSNTASCTVACDTGATAYGGITPIVCVITEAELRWNDAAIIEETYTFEVDGLADVV